MRIALFTETYLPDINGVATHLKTLKEGLEILGHEVLIVAADKHTKHHYIDQDNVLRCPAIESKRFYGFGVAAPVSRKRMRYVAEFNPDIIHIHHEFGVGLSGIYAAKVIEKPLVYTLHTMYDQYVYYVAPRPFLKIATKLSHRYERFIANRAQALVGPSQKCDEYFKRIGVNNDQFNLIPNSADLEMFNYENVSAEKKSKLREKLGISPDKSVACFVGRMGNEKSVDVLIDFWANNITKNDNLHLLLVGEGPSKEELEEQVQKLGISHMVTFTGRVEHPEMPTYFSICDAYVTASLSEMNSISMLEGMGSGLPTLQRYDELNADQIQTGVNGYLYTSGAELADHLKHISQMTPDKKLNLKKTVRESVANRGCVGIANYMLGVYSGVIDKKAVSMNEYVH